MSFAIALINPAEYSVAFRFFGGAPEEVGRSWPPDEPIPAEEVKRFLLHAALGVARTLRPLPCAIMDARDAPGLFDGWH